jgi:hypothetical protein
MRSKRIEREQQEESHLPKRNCSASLVCLVSFLAAFRKVALGISITMENNQSEKRSEREGNDENLPSWAFPISSCPHHPFCFRQPFRTKSGPSFHLAFAGSRRGTQRLEGQKKNSRWFWLLNRQHGKRKWKTSCSLLSLGFLWAYRAFFLSPLRKLKSTKQQGSKKAGREKARKKREKPPELFASSDCSMTLLLTSEEGEESEVDFCLLSRAAAVCFSSSPSLVSGLFLLRDNFFFSSLEEERKGGIEAGEDEEEEEEVEEAVEEAVEDDDEDEDDVDAEEGDVTFCRTSASPEENRRGEDRVVDKSRK